MKTYSAVVDKYSKQATSYDRRWNVRWGEQTLRAAVETVPWAGAKRILDVGCGTGELEYAVRTRLRPPQILTGVDIARPMLLLAREKLSGFNTVNWTAAPAEQLPFVSAAFDTVVCNNSFHYYRQPLAVLKEFHRVLRPGCTLVLADWCNDFFTNKISQIVLHLAQHSYIYRYGLSRCYGSEEMASMLREAGFHVENLKKIGMEWGWGIMVFSAVA